MSTIFTTSVPFPYSGDDLLTSAYRRGWSHAHGIACHNVPKLGERVRTESMGRVTVDAENIRDVHAAHCYEAESNQRSFSPFEFTAHEFNSADCDDNGKFDPDKEGTAAELWEAFDAGVSDAINADLKGYTDDDYGIEPEPDYIVKGTAPRYWAPYFINDDASGMEDDEIAQADKFADWLGGRIVGCEAAGFLNWHDARQFGVLAADCYTYSAIIDEV
jgi:hypothetical protein